ncbi:MAG: hypothetical protein HXY43_14380 [Fischerella sp.]|nr:hypothetical protein [Fischerella sp. PCC 9605]NWF60406.1 hypothetical protein [Fischerella sp.]
MAIRNNNSDTNLWQKIQQDSVSWGALILWVSGLLVMLALVTMFAYA